MASRGLLLVYPAPAADFVGLAGNRRRAGLAVACGGAQPA